ncbi:xaa-Pro aminopeptidase 3-like [Panonychus citri]|uniref:xaa-Pro aminopeptidase 3-like n=1 Tax=Panonychus citri TaxID=50023 RepID=UPI0023077284|nr:xaa-Pro aminopeptidase 3-like [Panonychus citri]
MLISRLFLRRFSSSSWTGNGFFSRCIPTSEYCSRQGKLVNLIGDYVSRSELFPTKQSLIVVSGAMRQYTADTRIPSIHFKQNSDFLYLTGLNTKEAAHTVLIILGPDQSSSSYQSYLFVPFSNQLALIWEGEGLIGSYYKPYLTEVTHFIEDINKLPKFLSSHLDKNIFLCRAGLELIPPTISGHRDNLISDKPSNPLSGHKTHPLSPFIDRLRLIKSPNEINAMRRTCAIGAKAVDSTRLWTQEQLKYNQNVYGIDGVNENQIAAKFEFEARSAGAVKPSYPPVVAGADRTTIIHYGANDKFVQSNEWILMDAGCEDIEGYISDITRCWPIIGADSSSKCRLTQALYEALTEVHQQIVKYLENRALETSLNDLYHLMCHLLGSVLAEFNLCKSGDQAALLADHFCPHHVSHYLGLDVHDTPTINRDINLEPGMCFTIEPGLYFRHDDPKIKPEFSGIGLRVEDNFIINSQGKPENLTKSVSQIFPTS